MSNLGPIYPLPQSKHKIQSWLGVQFNLHKKYHADAQVNTPWGKMSMRWISKNHFWEGDDDLGLIEKFHCHIQTTTEY